MSAEEEKPTVQETETPTEKKAKKVKKVKKAKKTKELPDFTLVKVKSKPKTKSSEKEENDGLYTYDEVCFVHFFVK